MSRADRPVRAAGAARMVRFAAPRVAGRTGPGPVAALRGALSGLWRAVAQGGVARGAAQVALLLTVAAGAGQAVRDARSAGAASAHRLARRGRSALARFGMAVGCGMAYRLLGWRRARQRGLRWGRRQGHLALRRTRAFGQAGGSAGRDAIRRLGSRLGRMIAAARAWPGRFGLGLQRMAASAMVLLLAAVLAPKLEAQTSQLQPDLLPRAAESAPVLAAPPAGTPGAAPGAGTPPTPGRVTPLSGLNRSGADSNGPVTFQADEVEYDRERGIVTARGHVEAWQGERLLRADEFIHDRNTGVTLVRGHVELTEPDGQVLFADEAELKDRFRDGVLAGVRGLLAANGRVAANGLRRTGGTINELSRVVYSSCNLCAEDPTRPPLWQIRARIATQDKTEQRITYRDATVQIAGIPVFYTPYFSHPDPSSPRASGFLFPTLGITRFLGGFTEIPYFWAIDPSSDLTVTGLLSTRQYPNLGAEYRKLFNFGEIKATASLGGFNGVDTVGRSNGKENLAGHIFARGRFTLDENWRTGFDLNRATNDLYLRTFRYEYRRVLTSQFYVEGFWDTEGYARFDTRAYQGLRTGDDARQIPYVLPNAIYEYAPRAPVLGGHLTLDTGVLGIMRAIGSGSERIATRARWERSETDPLGGRWTFRAQGEALGYNAYGQGLSPTNLPSANGNHAVANVRAAIDWRMPFIRSGEWGSQVIEPRVQLVTGPNMGRQSRIPNDDSVDFEFTDANLFALNRYAGRDRQDGGSRVDMALRGAWMFPNGGQVEGLFGRSFRYGDLSNTPYALDGLARHGSDYVARVRLQPVSWLETIGRVRLDGEHFTQRRMADAVSTVTLGPISLSAGYLYSVPLTYLVPSRSRDEVSVGVGGRIGDQWRFNVSGRYDLSIGRPVLVQGSLTYEDECFILEGRFIKRFAQDPATNTIYPSNTVVLVRLGFKTIGEYFFRAL